jgi:hypothetical protein
MATFTITGRMSAKTVKKSLKEPSSSLSSLKYLPYQILFVFLHRKKKITHDRQSHDATDKTKRA